MPHVRESDGASGIKMEATTLSLHPATARGSVYEPACLGRDTALDKGAILAGMAER